VTDASDAPVRWGFLGAGMVAREALGPAVHAAGGAVLHTVGSRDPERAAALHPLHAAASYHAVLDDPDTEVVYVALANDAHLPWTLRALAAGKHVLCEKPLGLTAAEVDQMARAAALADRRVVEASWYRWHPRTRRAQQLIADGTIGTVREVAAGFTFAGVPAGSYRLDAAMGGGALYDVGCYAVSALLWAFGFAAVRGVEASVEVGETGVDVTTEADLAFDAGSGRFRAGIAERERQWLSIRGDTGTIGFEAPAFTAWHGDEAALTSPLGRETFAGADPYALMVEQVSASVRGRESWVVPVEESRAVAAALDAVRAAAPVAGWSS